MLRCCVGGRLALRAAAASRACLASRLPPACRAAAHSARRGPPGGVAPRVQRPWRPAAASADAVAAPSPGAPRSRLNEACLARNLVSRYDCDAGVGPSHAPFFTCRLHVTEPSGRVVAQGSGGGSSRGAAQDAAAAAALASMGTLASAPSEEREALAWVGDTAVDTLIALLGFPRGLSAEQLDGLRQRLATNAALGDGAPGRAAATTLEAAIGVEVLREAETLRPLLLAAVRRGAPALAAELEAAVASETPERTT